MTILIINPNSNEAVTRGLAVAVRPLILPGGPGIECLTLDEGPFGILTQHDVDKVALPLHQRVLARPDAEAFVIACFSDPGVAVCREATQVPVLGIRECAIMSALTQGDRFGIIALMPGSVQRHVRAVREAGVAQRFVGARALHLTVEAAETVDAYQSVRTVARALVKDGADTLLLGCAGMTRHRARLSHEVGVPVIDPVQASAVQALGLVLLTRSEKAALSVA